MSQTFYDVLGLPVDASSRAIRHAYHAAALKLHPDKNQTPSENNNSELFILATTACQILLDPLRRAAYDASILSGYIRDVGRVSGTLDFAEDFLPSGEDGVYVASCRCGGEYAINMLAKKEGVVHSECDCCSLVVAVENIP